MHVDKRITGPARFLRDDAARDDLKTKWTEVYYHVNLRNNYKEVRWRSWLSHLSNTQKVPGSSPGRTISFSTRINLENSQFRFAISFSSRRIILRWTRATWYIYNVCIFSHNASEERYMREMDDKLPPVSQSFLRDLSSPSSRDEQWDRVGSTTASIIAGP
jgi:hypothetical protein